MKASALSVLVVVLVASTVSASELIVELSPEQRLAMGIETLVLGEQVYELSDPLPGRLVLNDRHQRSMTIPVSGTVERLDVLPGAQVSPGDQLGLYQSREALVLQRDYLGAVDRLERSTASKQRDQSLHEGGVISRKRWQQTLSEWRQKDAMVIELAGQLTALGFDEKELEQLRNSRQIRDRLPLRAPIEGAVLERHIYPGEAFVAGQELFHLGDVNKLWLSIQAPASLVGDARTGDMVYLGQRELGRLLQVGAAVDAATQAVEMTAEVTALPEGMLPGQSMLVRLQSARRQGLWLPQDSLVNIGGDSVVFVVDGDHFVLREVEVSVAAAGWVALAGLQQGEEVAVSGVASLKGAALGMGGVAEHDH